MDGHANANATPNQTHIDREHCDATPGREAGWCYCILYARYCTNLLRTNCYTRVAAFPASRSGCNAINEWPNATVPSPPSIHVYIFGFLRRGTTTVQSVGLSAGMRRCLGMFCALALPGCGGGWNVTSRWRRLSFSEIQPWASWYGDLLKGNGG